MGENAIKAENVRYSYGKTLAVDGISFQVERGEVMGFLGPNGAGKSTTIKMLTGMLTPQSGKVELLGLDVSSNRKKVQARIGVCFEEKNLYLNMSGKENLVFFARLFGISGYDPEEALRRVGLSERGGDRVKKYSKGMRQRLMVARALVNRPDVLFLDEPTEDLDVDQQARFLEVFSELEEHHLVTILVSSNDPNVLKIMKNDVIEIGK